MLGSDRAFTHEEDAMDDGRCESLAQQISTRLSRRTGLRFLTSLSVLGLALPRTAETKKKKHKPSPPPSSSPAPPSPVVQVVETPGTQLFTAPLAGTVMIEAFGAGGGTG